MTIASHCIKHYGCIFEKVYPLETLILFSWSVIGRIFSKASQTVYLKINVSNFSSMKLLYNRCYFSIIFVSQKCESSLTSRVLLYTIFNFYLFYLYLCYLFIFLTKRTSLLYKHIHILDCYTSQQKIIFNVRLYSRFVFTFYSVGFFNILFFSHRK